MSKHTPGPWQAKMPYRDDVHMGRITTAWKKDDCFLVVAQCGLDHVYVGLTGVERVFNAYLIAAAPDYDKAAREMIDRHDAYAKRYNFERCGCDDCKPFRAIVAKAEGR